MGIGECNSTKELLYGDEFKNNFELKKLTVNNTTQKILKEFTSENYGKEIDLKSILTKSSNEYNDEELQFLNDLLCGSLFKKPLRKKLLKYIKAKHIPTNTELKSLNHILKRSELKKAITAERLFIFYQALVNDRYRNKKLFNSIQSMLHRIMHNNIKKHDISFIQKKEIYNDLNKSSENTIKDITIEGKYINRKGFGGVILSNGSKIPYEWDGKGYALINIEGIDIKNVKSLEVDNENEGKLKGQILNPYGNKRIKFHYDNKKNIYTITNIDDNRCPQKKNIPTSLPQSNFTH